MTMNPLVRVFYPKAEVVVHLFHRTSSMHTDVDYSKIPTALRRILAGTNGKWVLGSAFINVSSEGGPQSNLVPNYVSAIRATNH